jgi:rsbT co-antagonist protein RsbR
VWAVDRQGVFTHHEGKGLAAAGLKAGQWLGRNIFELYGSAEGAMDGIQRALKGELTHWVNEAHGIYWETWVVPMRDEHGEVASVLGLSLDVSETKRAHDRLREEIERQAAAIRALSTPIIEVWDKVLTLPLLGVLDSRRAASVMENLLNEVSRKGARFAILDLTGVETVDTSTANHLLKLIQAIRLLGAEGIITGIQPNVAQTMIALGMDLGPIATLATLRDGLRYCITRMREGAARQGEPPPQANSG